MVKQGLVGLLLLTDVCSQLVGYTLSAVFCGFSLAGRRVNLRIEISRAASLPLRHEAHFFPKTTED